MTENNISSASDTITMYCTQTDLVWDIVDKDGVNYVLRFISQRNIRTLPDLILCFTKASTGSCKDHSKATRG